MTKGRTTTTLGLRLSDDFIQEVIAPRANKAGLTVTEFCRQFLVKEMSRRHKKNAEGIVRISEGKEDYSCPDAYSGELLEPDDWLG